MNLTFFRVLTGLQNSNQKVFLNLDRTEFKMSSRGSRMDGKCMKRLNGIQGVLKRGKVSSRFSGTPKGLKDSTWLIMHVLMGFKKGSTGLSNKI